MIKKTKKKLTLQIQGFIVILVSHIFKEFLFIYFYISPCQTKFKARDKLFVSAF